MMVSGTGGKQKICFAEFLQGESSAQILGCGLIDINWLNCEQSIFRTSGKILPGPSFLIYKARKLEKNTLKCLNILRVHDQMQGW